MGTPRGEDGEYKSIEHVSTARDSLRAIERDLVQLTIAEADLRAKNATMVRVVLRLESQVKTLTQENAELKNKIRKEG